MTELIEKLLGIDDALRAASIPHAFGGAIALAYCTEEPRGTRDLDVNIFVDAGEADRVLAQLPEGVGVTAKDIKTVERDGQTRLWWDGVPVDVFLNNLPLHEAAAEGVVWVPLEERQIPVLDCASLVIFKALFDRPKDWADIHAVSVATPEDLEIAARTLADLVGREDPVFKHLTQISTANSP